ncbi:MAG: DUF1800 domain-containing protein, partial [Planctomycetota bacterium]
VWGVGCGGGGGGGGAPPPQDPFATQEDASRFLAQATFGATQQELQVAMALGREGWIDRQMQIRASSQVEYLNALGQATPAQDRRVEGWWQIVLTGDDQLRQRVAWALSQILVISDADMGEDNVTYGMATYYDMLATNAFGNYRELLEQVTLSPVMGRYLSMVRNEKADPAENIRPDENYAREVMQLFSIGLETLNQDGTAVIGTDNNPVPTYDQSVIEGFAAVFTGWNYAGIPSWNNGSYRNYVDPMEPNEQFHDTNIKTILNGQVLPAGRDARTDLESALDAIFNHPNVAPFISKQLIQRLVTSNPTPAYVSRVSAVFRDNGSGVRGDLGAVVRAILLDDEAKNGHTTMPTTFGKLKEPLLRVTQMWRAFQARAGTTGYAYGRPERDFDQAPLRAPSVFNFYRPEYSQPGEIADANLVSPEFQILTETAIMGVTNQLYDRTVRGYSGAPGTDFTTILLILDFERALANAPIALVDHLNLLLMAGQMPSTMRQTLINYVDALPFDDGGNSRVAEAIFLIVSSPEFAIQR